MRRLVLLLLLSAGVLRADGPADNIPDKVRVIPPPGVELPEADRVALEAGLSELDQALAALRSRKDERTRHLLPDVEIFARAVRHAVLYRELFKPGDIKDAKDVLQEGLNRASSLLKGEAPWTRQKGLVVRGYVSRIDRTVQPYGLVIPESYSFEEARRFRLDLWLHGRGETLSESVFIAGRMKQAGQVVPRNTIVLHPYGRYCNANKFAGEIDVLEAMEHARQHYRVDEDRIAVRGFSMGGAGCWQMAVHYPDLFFAANPGAGFSETPEFLKVFQKEELKPTWYERKLWQHYDCPPVALNLTGLPTIAYSGELDTQKQAADIMEQALAAQGIRLTHIIGPQTKHSIHPESLREIEARLASLAVRGRVRVPQQVVFQTPTLRYNRSHWVTVTALSEHWNVSTVTARLATHDGEIRVQTTGVEGLKLQFDSGWSPFPAGQPVTVIVDGQKRGPFSTETDRSLTIELQRAAGEWKNGSAHGDGLTKRHGLQGPIDDAFMDSFIVVRPTGRSRHEAIDVWSKAELDHCVEHWRRHFRGDAIVKDDTAVTEHDIASASLILFGDPASNSVLSKIADRLPIQWSESTVKAGGSQFDAAHHAPVMIYPNPLNPGRYVVLNSGFTFREFAYLNNARQVPKLPDWAIIDVRTPPNPLWSGQVVAADFFDERWNLKPAR